MLSLIDGDICAYRCGFTTEEESAGIAIARLDVMVERILEETDARSHKIYLSDCKENNYRYKYLPTYKANRTKPHPIHLAVLKERLINRWGAEVTPNQEADDALGIEQSKGNDTIICTIDKDLKQVPGKHYNFVKQEFSQVDYLEGMANFYEQLLVGDRADNVLGVDGIGVVKAAKAMAYMESELDMFDYVRAKYNDDVRLLNNMRVLWVRRLPEEIKGFPNET